MNPHYSAKWTAAKGFANDPWFSDYGGVLPPQTRRGNGNSPTSQCIFQYIYINLANDLKKRQNDRSVFFLDAKDEFAKKGTQNTLTEENIEKIAKTYLAK